MISTHAAAVHSFYFAYYGRPADPDGLAFWTGQLDAAGGDVDAIAGAFAQSQEATVRFGDQSTAERVASVYQQLFNRAPEAAGVAFWSAAVDSGQTTLAEVVRTILQGAQGSDADIAGLRLQAAEDFTASVSAGQIDYTGYAAIEASRVLLSAVTPDTTKAELAAMVSKVQTLVTIAHDTPAVLAAIGLGGDLAALFATTRGRAEPEQLFHALIDLAIAASGNPATLSSLLRGGGMNGVLDAMPKGASLQDVVDALGSGGLAAAIEVVYPTPAPTLPSDRTGPTVSSLTFGENDGKLALGERIDLTVEFSESVRIGSAATLAFENGGSAHYLSGSGSNTLVFSYTPAAGESTDGFALRLAAAPLSGAITDRAGNALAADAFGVQPIPNAPSVDVDAPTAVLQINTISQATGRSEDMADSDAPLTTNDEEAVVYGTLDAALAGGERVEYSIDGGASWTRDGVAVDGTGVSIVGVITVDNPTLMVRVVDAAGNVGSQASHAIVFDDVAPSGGSVTFSSVNSGALDGDAGDNVTNQALVNVMLDYTGAWPGAGERFQYTIGSQTWADGGVSFDEAAGTITVAGVYLGGLAPDPVSGDRSGTLSLRVIDAAGNATYIDGVDLVLDNSAPVVEFLKLAGAADGVTDTTTETADVVFGYDRALGDPYAIAIKVDGVAWAGTFAVDTDALTITLQDVDLSSDPTIEVSVTDAAGNLGQTAEVTIASSWEPPTISLFSMSAGLFVTSPAAGDLYVKNVDTGVETLVFPGITAGMPAMIGVQTTTALSGTILVRSTDGDLLADPEARLYHFGTASNETFGNGLYNMSDTTVWGYGGADALFGGILDDVLYGGDGDDSLYGNNGNDHLVGGAGHNYLTGGYGADTFDLSQGRNSLSLMEGDSTLMAMDVLNFNGNTNQLQSIEFGFAIGTLHKQANAEAPLDDTPEALLSALNVAYELALGAQNYGTVLVEFADGSNYLVVDTGNGRLDDQDYIIELVGTYTDARIADSNVVFGSPA